MTAKSLPKDLLEQAEHLANRESNRPKQASLRRAVSTAYYSLFHLLCAEGSELLAPNIDEAIRNKVQRWFDHGAMKETCGRFLAEPLGKPLHDLLGPAASADLLRVARIFIELQHARILADYDMGWTVHRPQVLQFIQQAQDARDAWLRIRKTAEANIFVLSIFLWKQWERPR